MASLGLTPQRITEHLRQLLLPESFWAAAEAAEGRWSVAYALGPGADSGAAPAGKKPSWTSVPAGGNERSKVRELAEPLWERMAGAERPPGSEPVLAVADPVSNTITLSLRLPPDQPETAAGVRNLLGAVVESFLHLTRSFAESLLRRPCLHVVLLGEGPVAVAVESAVETLMRQLGLYLGDFQVRWLDLRHRQEPDEILKELLLFHMPWPIWPDPAAGLDAKGIEHLCGAVSSFRQALDETHLNSDHEPFEAAEAFYRLLDSFPALPLEPTVAAPQPLDQIAPDSPHSFPMTLCLRARQWQHAPVAMSLAPLTLLYGDNAAGKTTLAEALCYAHTGLPRARIELPAGSTEWTDRRGRGRATPPAQAPSLSLVRLCFGGRPAPEAPRSHAAYELFPAREILPLFAEDSELTRGHPGDLSVGTWLPFPGLRGSSSVAGTGATQLAADLVEILKAGKRLQVEIEQLAAVALTAPPAELGPNDLVAVPKWLIEEMKTLLAEKLEQEEEAPAQDRLKSELKALKRRRTQVPRRIIHELIEDLAQFTRLRIDSTAGSTTWADLKALDHALGGHTAFEQVVRSHLSTVGLQRFRQRLEILLKELPDQLFGAISFEQELDRFLSLTVDADFVEPVRRNTAALVRLGQAARLARWLCCGGLDWPLLIVDEPALGQDEASCSRALGRLLRLLRKAEAWRWARRAAAGRDTPLPATTAWVERAEIKDLAAWVAQRRKPATDELAEAPAVVDAPDLPLPPHALTLSYRETALSVVSDLEGVVLDHSLRRELENLLPRMWWTPLQDSLGKAREYYLADLAATGAATAGHSVMPQVLRSYWQPPLQEILRPPDEDEARMLQWQRWLEKAEGCLQRLHLSGLATDLRRTAGEDHSSVRDFESAALRLLLWLLATDLLPAALADGEQYFSLSGVSFQALPRQGGMARELGPTRLRRVVPLMDWLPPLPQSWAKQMEPAVKPAAPSIKPPRHEGPWKIAVIGRLDAAEPLHLEPTRREVQQAGFDLARSPAEADLTVEVSGDVPRFGSPAFSWRLLKGEEELDRGKLSEFEKGLEPLLAALVKRRANELAATAAESWINVVLATYAPQESPVVPIAFRFADTSAPGGGKPADLGSRAARSRWERIFGDGLLRLRTALAASPHTRQICLVPRCALAVALRAGTIFHRASDFRVRVHQQHNVQWDLAGHVEEATEARTSIRKENTGAEELHVLVAVTQDVWPSYEAWSSAAPRPSAQVVDLRPDGSPSHTAIRGGAHALGWADQVYLAIAQLRAERLPVRLFMAVPAALAVAIGRQLNKVGEVIVMEYHFETGQYFEALRFRA